MVYLINARIRFPNIIERKWCTWKMFCISTESFGFNVPNLLHERIYVRVCYPFIALLLTISLESVSDAIGVQIKSRMKSNDVDKHWADGRCSLLSSFCWSLGQNGKKRVVDHVLEDSVATLEVIERVETKKHITWITQAKKPGMMSLVPLVCDPFSYFSTPGYS
jgi:hypothetical protein